jgi:hypothetical protein
VTRRANHFVFFNFPCPAPFAKIFWFSERPNQFYIPVVLSFREGRWPSSRTLGRDAVDARSAQDESALLRTEKSCGPDASTPASSWQLTLPATVTKKPDHRGEYEGNR